MDKKEKDLIKRLQNNINRKRTLVDEFYGELNDNQKEICVDLAEDSNYKTNNKITANNNNKTDIIDLEEFDALAEKNAKELMWYDNWAEKWGDNKIKTNNQIEKTPSSNPSKTTNVSLVFGGVDDEILPFTYPQPNEISDIEINRTENHIEVSFRVTPIQNHPYVSNFLYLHLPKIYLLYGDGNKENDTLDFVGKHFELKELYLNSQTTELDEFNFFVTITKNID